MDSQLAHSARLLLESLGACLVKMSMANSWYSSRCSSVSVSSASSRMKAFEHDPKALKRNLFC